MIHGDTVCNDLCSIGLQVPYICIVELLNVLISESAETMDLGPGSSADAVAAAAFGIDVMLLCQAQQTFRNIINGWFCLGFPYWIIVIYCNPQYIG